MVIVRWDTERSEDRPDARMMVGRRGLTATCPHPTVDPRLSEQRARRNGIMQRRCCRRAVIIYLEENNMEFLQTASRYVWTWCAALIAVLNVTPLIAEDAASRPNILIIFTDDQGYADLASYGNDKNKTPRLDRLAKEGTRFTSFYAQTVCGPSRSALLTGRHPIRSNGWRPPRWPLT